MIVTFDPAIGTTAPSSAAKYMNFLRCVTAACTAAAGTTSLTVNPWTSTTAIDATKNCIISIDANTEAGGWTTSTGTIAHNVVNSGSFTAPVSAGNYNAATSYKADFYNASGKSQFPYNKLSFHMPVNNTYDSSGYAGPVMPANWDSYAGVCCTIGSSTSIDWTDTGWQPTNGNNNFNNSSGRSFTSGKRFSTMGSPYYTQEVPALPWMSSISQNDRKWRIAVTANYCIIWTERYDNTYAAGYNYNQSTYGQGNAWGGILYMGLRETQAWENSLNFNPPIVMWEWLNRAQTAQTTYQSYCQNNVGAWMATIDNAGGVSTTGVGKTVSNSYATANWQDAKFNSGNALQTPIFYSRAMDGTSADSPYAGGSTTRIQYPPQADTSTGVQVPGAYPIVIRSNTSGAWNAGGQCRGIYKSISMPWTTMKLYWTAANQTFTVNGENYIPIVFNEDMFLIRNI